MHWPRVCGRAALTVVSGRGLQNWRSVLEYGPLWFGKDFTFLMCTYEE